MRVVELLEESTFEKEGEGKVTFKEDDRVWSMRTLPAEEVDKKIKYKFLNPLQTVFHYAYNGGNAVVSAPTSAGKSLVAYLFFRKFNGRKVYTAPTKSLVYEKFREFKDYYEHVDIRTGDSVIEELKEVKGELVVSTYESLAQAFRNNADWTRDISAIVIDEVHQIRTRPAVEELIVYGLNKGIALLGLSATLPDVKKFSKWFRAELLIISTWRPVPLERSVHSLKDFSVFKKKAVKTLFGKIEPEEEGEGEEKKDENREVAEALWNALYTLSKPDEQVILFVPSKSLGWDILQLANEEKVGVMNETVPFEKEDREPEIAFHCADVPKEEREKIEKAFREGKIKKLIATQTLAYGVNLPADRVIIYVKDFWDIAKRGTRVVPDVLDILQMEGRAGRYGKKEKGYSNIICRSKEVIEEKLNEKDKQGFTTSLTELEEEEKKGDALALRVLLAYLYEPSEPWRFLKMFYNSDNIDKEDFHWAIRFLKEHRFIEKDCLTEKGSFCVRSGIPPTGLEEFLRRRNLGLYDLAVIRPLLHTKTFSGLFGFVKKALKSIEDKEEKSKKLDHYKASLREIEGILLRGDENCRKDNTHEFLFYTEGYLFYYRNIKNPPGEFSYLYADALHLLRTLYELKKLGFFQRTDLEILEICHSVKTGLNLCYSALAGVNGIGHIRANLIKLLFQDEKVEPPKLFDPVSKLLEKVRGRELKMIDLLVKKRGLLPSMANREVEIILKILEGNQDGVLVDDKLLLMYSYLKFGKKVIKFKKDELVKLVKEVCSKE